MKLLVTYWSQTGNTRRVAEAIYSALPGEKHLKTFDEAGNLDGFDLVFVGFPVMQFGPPGPVKKFIAAHAAGKRIALFLTHAMFTNSNDPGRQSMLAKELERCRGLFSKSELAGLYHCQGELSKTVADELAATGIPMLMEFAAMQPLTAGHPDSSELEQAAVFAKTLVINKKLP